MAVSHIYMYNDNVNGGINVPEHTVRAGGPAPGVSPSDLLYFFLFILLL